MTTALTVTERGDGSFAVYRTDDHTQLAAGRIGAEGTALVLLDPTGQTEKHVPGEQKRVERLASGLVPKSFTAHHGPDLIFRATSWDPVAFSAGRPAPGDLARGQKRSIDVIDLTSGRQQQSLSLGEGSGKPVLSFIQGGAALAIGSSDRCVRIWRFQPVEGACCDPRARSEGNVGTRILARQPHTRLRWG